MRLNNSIQMFLQRPSSHPNIFSWDMIVRQGMLLLRATHHIRCDSAHRSFSSDITSEHRIVQYITIYLAMTIGTPYYHELCALGYHVTEVNSLYYFQCDYDITVHPLFIDEHCIRRYSSSNIAMRQGSTRHHSRSDLAFVMCDWIMNYILPHRTSNFAIC